MSDLEKQLDAARSELERRAVYGGRTRDDDEPSRRAAKLAFELEICREEAAELQGRVNSLSAANDALTQTNASLSEQVRWWQLLTTDYHGWPLMTVDRELHLALRAGALMTDDH